MAEQTDSTASPEQLCFAVHTSGTLVTRDGGRPLWATRAEWEQFPQLVTQLIPINGAPPMGSLPFLDTGRTPDVVGRLLELTAFLEKGATMLAERIERLDNQLNARVHERELLARAAELIEPDRPALAGEYEQRLDWLAKWREVTGRG